MSEITRYKCDRCGTMTDSPWAEVCCHTDIVGGGPATTHLCRACWKPFCEWMREPELGRRRDGE